MPTSSTRLRHSTHWYESFTHKQRNPFQLYQPPVVLSEASLPPHISLCGLSPLGQQADQTADCTTDTDNTVIEVEVLERGNRRGQIANIGKELGTGRRAFPVVSILATSSQRITNRGHTSQSSWPRQHPHPPCGQPSSPSPAISTTSTGPKSH